jgi:hypothetical protein
MREVPGIARPAGAPRTAVLKQAVPCSPELVGKTWEGVRPAGLEPATHSLEGCCSIHLSYGRVLPFNNLEEAA